MWSLVKELNYIWIENWRIADYYSFCRVCVGEWMTMFTHKIKTDFNCFVLAQIKTRKNRTNFFRESTQSATSLLRFQPDDGLKLFVFIYGPLESWQSLKRTCDVFVFHLYLIYSLFKSTYPKAAHHSIFESTPPRKGETASSSHRFPPHFMSILLVDEASTWVYIIQHQSHHIYIAHANSELPWTLVSHFANSHIRELCKRYRTPHIKWIVLRTFDIILMDRIRMEVDS